MRIILPILFLVIYVSFSSSVAHAQAPNVPYQGIKPAVGARLNNGTPSGNLNPVNTQITVRTTSVANSVIVVADKMSTLSAKLQIRITEAKNNGKEVSALEALLVSMNGKILNAKTAATSVLTSLPQTNTLASMQSAKVAIQGAVRNLKSAAVDARQIIAGLIKLNVGNNAALGNSSSASSMMKPAVVNQVAR